MIAGSKSEPSKDCQRLSADRQTAVTGDSRSTKKARDPSESSFCVVLPILPGSPHSIWSPLPLSLVASASVAVLISMLLFRVGCRLFTRTNNVYHLYLHPQKRASPFLHVTRVIAASNIFRSDGLHLNSFRIEVGYLI